MAAQLGIPLFSNNENVTINRTYKPRSCKQQKEFEQLFLFDELLTRQKSLLLKVVKIKNYPEQDDLFSPRFKQGKDLQMSI